jgi:hypothetical protein
VKRLPPLVGLVFLLVSCASSPLRVTSFVDDPYKDAAVRVSVLGAVPEGSSLPQGLTVQCVNDSGGPITVKWEKSLIVLNGASDRTFLEGEKYEDIQKGAPQESVPARSRVVETVYPVNNVVAQPGAYGVQTLRISPLGSRQVSLSICVDVAGVDRYYTMHVNMEPQASALRPPITGPAPDGHMSTQ